MGYDRAAGEALFVFVVSSCASSVRLLPYRPSRPPVQEAIRGREARYVPFPRYYLSASMSLNCAVQRRRTLRWKISTFTTQITAESTMTLLRCARVQATCEGSCYLSTSSTFRFISRTKLSLSHALSQSVKISLVSAFLFLPACHSRPLSDV